MSQPCRGCLLLDYVSVTHAHVAVAQETSKPGQLHTFVCHVSRIGVAHRIKHSDTVRHSCFSIRGSPELTQVNRGFLKNECIAPINEDERLNL